MKYFYCEELACVYWLDEEALMFATLNKDNTFELDADGDGAVDEGMADEPVGDPNNFTAPIRTLGDVWAEARKALK